MRETLTLERELKKILREKKTPKILDLNSDNILLYQPASGAPYVTGNRTQPNNIL
ncbi:hypothetical protein Hanom_Chr10g00955011 [Helianthus anomalus]